MFKDSLTSYSPQYKPRSYTEFGKIKLTSVCDDISLGLTVLLFSHGVFFEVDFATSSMTAQGPWEIASMACVWIRKWYQYLISLSLMAVRIQTSSLPIQDVNPRTNNVFVICTFHAALTPLSTYRDLKMMTIQPFLYPHFSPYWNRTFSLRG